MALNPSRFVRLAVVAMRPLPRLVMAGLFRRSIPAPKTIECQPKHSARSSPRCRALRGRPSSIERKCFGLALFVGLVLTFVAPSVWAQCNVEVPIEPNATVNGRLGPGDCDIGIAFLDFYRLNLPAPGTLDVRMTSDQIDSLLFLFDEFGEDIDSDDDGGGGFNSLIVVPNLPAGSYIIVASYISFMHPETGFYTLSTTFTPSAFTVTATAGAGGTISPQGSVSVNTGSDQTFTISPDSGFVVSDVRVDGVSMGAVTTFTFSAVDADHTIDAQFVVVANKVISAIAGQGGTISPSGGVSVAVGADQTFNITPNSGFLTSDVIVDGNSIGPATAFTFTDVTSDHTIEARFFEVYPAIAPALQLLMDDEGAQ